MNTDTPERVTLIPIDHIEVLNSRDRNAKVFEEIVENIQDMSAIFRHFEKLWF
jgi:ParB family chromosome partitioning protein